MNTKSVSNISNKYYLNIVFETRLLSHQQPQMYPQSPKSVYMGQQNS